MPTLRLFASEHPALEPSLETGYTAVSGSTGFLSGAALGLVIMLGPVVPAVDAQSTEASMFVSVLDENGAPVHGLGPTDFIIEEDGNQREVLRVKPATIPMQIAVLVDTSTAAASTIRDIRNGLVALVDGLQDGNEIALVSFGGTPRILVESTSRPERLHDGIGQVFAFPDSAAYLLDALVETARGFERRAAARPVIVAITTEGVDYSNRDARQVVEALRDSGAAAHTVVLQTRLSAPVATDTGFGFGNDGRERDLVLNQGPRASGGQRIDVLLSPRLSGVLTELVSVLRNQNEVVYARPASLIPPEEISVRMRQNDLTVRGTPTKRTED